MKQSFELEVVETSYRGSALAQARELATCGCEIVAAAGGDGTVTDVMQGILGTGAKLAILPMGTGNDFARAIGVGPELEDAVRSLIAGHSRAVDVVRWSNGSTIGHFINVAGCGFDAAVAKRINTGIRWLRGQPAYLAAILACLASYRPTPIRIDADGQIIEESVMLCAFANATSYGGGMLIAPTAKLDDGMLDIVLVSDMSRLAFLRSFPLVLKGAHLSHPKVRHLRSRRVEFDLTGPFLVDGELAQGGHVSLEVVPQAIEVVSPASA